MLNGADITSGPIMMNSQMSLLGHISTGPYNITSQGSALYDAIASDAEEKLTNLQVNFFVKLSIVMLFSFFFKSNDSFLGLMC